MLFVALGYFKLPFRGRGPHWSFHFFPLCQLRATELNESGCPTQCFETHRSQPEQLRHLPFKALISCAAKQRCGGDIRATCLGRPPGRWWHGNRGARHPRCGGHRASSHPLLHRKRHASGRMPLPRAQHGKTNREALVFQES